MNFIILFGHTPNDYPNQLKNRFFDLSTDESSESSRRQVILLIISSSTMHNTDYRFRVNRGVRTGIWSVLAIFLWYCPSAQTLSPVVITPYAGSAQAGNITLDWTTGEIASSVGTSKTRLYTEGFNQPLLNITPQLPEEGSETGTLATAISVFPNPAHTSFMVRFDQQNFGGGIIDVLDLQGRLVDSHQIEPGTRSAEISVMDYPSGLYLVRVIVTPDENQRIYKLSKI